MLLSERGSISSFAIQELCLQVAPYGVIPMYQQGADMLPVLFAGVVKLAYTTDLKSVGVIP